MNLKLKVLMIGIIMPILISGCVEKPSQNNVSINTSPSTPFFPTQKNYTELTMDALLEGKLVLEDGCLRVDDYLLVWPYNFSMSSDGDVIRIIDIAGKPVARVGDKVNLGGGGGEMSGDSIAKYSADLPSARCPGPYWIVGEVLNPTMTPAATLPSFQPGMWDKDVVTPPAGQDGLQPPFMFGIDINSSYGFDRKYLEHETYGKPVFVLSKGNSATIILSVSSLSNRTVQISLENIDGLPAGATAKLEPESITLKPDEQGKFELNLTASPASPVSTPEPEIPAYEEFTALRLKGDGWSIGKAIIVKII